VAGVAAGDVVALEVDDFCRREYPRLYGTLRLYCGDVSLAEELAQEAFARAVRHWDKVATMAAPGAWVHRVALNLANSRFRRSAAERRALARARGGDSFEGPDSPTLIAVRQAVAALPPRQREVVILRFFHDLSVRATAERMACAEGTVKSLLADAIRSLRARGLEVDDDG
jgi:RNA polymerase sigma-70 factor (ECF subfamily)